MLLNGDCLDILPLLDAESFDSCVTDPPYGLSKEPDMVEVLHHWLAGDDYAHNSSGFMGKTWDSFVPGPSVWREVHRVLKPGGYVLAFFGTRTYDMGVLAMRLAGFEIRDQVGWGFLSGFPKSHDISKAIDKAAGAEGKAVRRMIPGADQNATGSWIKDNGREFLPTVTAPATAAAAEWKGWGSALKPSWEPVVLARKPLIGTLAQNVLVHRTGGLNIDGCRVPFADESDERESKAKNQHADFGSGPMTNEIYGKFTKDRENYDPEGRWPANMLHDGVFEPLFGDRSRIFFCAKANKADRNDGLEQFVERPSAASEFRPNHTEKAATGDDGNPYGRWKPLKNNHPTVKPTDLMQYLCRLVTPPGGHVLDPFAGSGSTGRAAVLEGFQFTGIEMDERFVEIAEARIAASEKRVLAEMYE